jgi:hypothetical protein
MVVGNCAILGGASFSSHMRLHLWRYFAGSGLGQQMNAAFIGAEMVRMMETHNAREAFIKTLPKGEQDAIRAADKREHEAATAHARALEIAEAGRARNFWGN